MYFKISISVYRVKILSKVQYFTLKSAWFSKISLTVFSLSIKMDVNKFTQTTYQCNRSIVSRISGAPFVFVQGNDIIEYPLKRFNSRIKKFVKF